MIPAPFAFVRATSVDQAVAALAEHGDDAKLLAGGHSLLPLMKLRLATPAVLVDVNDVPDHAGSRLDGDDVVVGGLTRHCDLVTSPVLREHLPLLSAAAEAVGDPQIRHRGTLAGSIAHGDPASDLPAAVLALGGTIAVHGPAGVRTVGADDFFLGFLETALAPDEMITELRFPRCTGAGWGFEKFNKRAQDWAIVGVAAVGGDRPGVALVNMAPTPVRAGIGRGRVAGRRQCGRRRGSRRCRKRTQRGPERLGRVPPPSGAGPRRARAHQHRRR